MNIILSICVLEILKLLITRVFLLVQETKLLFNIILRYSVMPRELFKISILISSQIIIVYELLILFR